MQNKANTKRCTQNPLIVPSQVTPSRENFFVEGVFNCAATKYKDEYILLCRIAESVKNDDESRLSFPVIKEVNGKSEFEVMIIDKKNSDYDYSDPRIVTLKGSKNVVYLTSLSHIRIARSKDGISFILDNKPVIMPNYKEESWGMEDPRITKIENRYYINYTAVSPNGAATSMISTEDFLVFKRHGIVFMPENKDVTIFPEKIGGKYFAFTRPVPNAIGSPDIWLSESEDLIYWGKHKHFLGISREGWDNGRLGGGAPPVLIDGGWLVVYHGADADSRYCLGALLLDKDDPMKVLARGKLPLLEPDAEYEKVGFFSDVVFACGCILEENNLIIYYGAADDKICRADISVEDIKGFLGV